jgi:hypothetical protein
MPTACGSIIGSMPTRREFLQSAAAASAAVALPTSASASAAPIDDPAAAADEFLGPLDAAHREWHRIWSEHPRSVILAPIGVGLTSHIEQRAIWEFSRNRDLRVKVMKANGKGWSLGKKDPWQYLHPPRTDLLIIDGIETYVTATSDAARAEINARIECELEVVVQGGRVWVCGHRWWDGDIYAGFIQRGYFAAKYEAHDFPTVLPRGRVDLLTADLGPQWSELMLYNRVPG